MEFYAVWYISLRTILVDRNPLKFHDQFYTWWLLRLHFAEEGPNSLCVFIIQKSDNLQFDMLVRWVAGTNDSSAKRLMFQVLLFFHNFFQKSFQFIFSSFYKFTKIKTRSFECLKSIRNYEKK